TDDAVVLFMQNSRRFIIGYFAAHKLGAIAAPCNPMFKEWELEYQLNDLRAKVIIIANNLMSVFNNIKDNTSVEQVLLIDYEPFLNADAIEYFPEKKEKDYQENYLVTKLESVINSNQY